MVVQTTVQCNRQKGKADWWTIDFGPIVDICKVPTYVPTDDAQPKGVYGPPLPPISFTMK